MIAYILKRGDMCADRTLSPRGSIGRGQKSLHDPQKGSVTAPRQHTAGFYGTYAAMRFLARLGPYAEQSARCIAGMCG